MPKLKSIADLEKIRQRILSQRDHRKTCIAINVMASCGLCSGSEETLQALVTEIKKQDLQGKVDIRATGCLGFCENSPIMLIFPEEICYLRVKPEDVPEIVSKTLVEKKVVDRLLYVDKNGKRIKYRSEIPFYKHQSSLIFGNNRLIDPKSIDDYVALGGYFALAKALSKMTPEQVLETVKEANLRGRGGGGFPAGVKWETTRNAPGEVKYVIVNAHEGEPGAFMDRALFTGNPHSVLEGLIIGAYAISSHEGYIYARDDIPLLVDSITTSLAQAQEYGLLGKNILGSGFSFNVKIHRDMGIFVSGESSALMTAIEGRAPEPRPKYIHTSVSGIWEKPSNLNNAETWANVPLIIDRGAEWFTGIGTERSNGTKLISLAGNINNTGVIEVPMGTTLKKLIYNLGGGIPNGKKFKAVHIGGPLGGCIPESLLDILLDFDELSKAEAPIGADGMIVIDEATCMVDLARYFLNFLSGESCGKCVPCREGLRQMLNVFDRICAGGGRRGDVELLEELSGVVSDTALCALGRGAANPVLSTIRHFRDEYNAHIEQKHCSAGICNLRK